MEQVKLSTLEKQLHQIIESVSRSEEPVLITDGDRSLVKIMPAKSSTGSWLGSMRDRGKILGDIISPVETPEFWQVLSE